MAGNINSLNLLAILDICKKALIEMGTSLTGQILLPEGTSLKGKNLVPEGADSFL